MESISPVRPAFDPVLRRQPSQYGSLLAELCEAGITDVSEHAQGSCGVFFVTRKDRLLRLIFDPKAANAACEVPMHCPLPSPACLRSIELGKGETLKMRTADVEVCFYQYSSPPWLKQLMTLPPVKAKYVPKK